MHWLTIVGIIFIALGTYATYSGQQINSETTTNLLLSKNDELQVSNQQLQADLDIIKTTNEELKRRIQVLSGVITPNDKPTPPNTCGSIPDNTLALFFGNSVSYTSTFPHTIIEIGSEKILTINKRNNQITISANFFSKDGKIVAELKENQFFVNPNNYFRIERPNEHTLIVYDQETNQILNIEYLNPSVIKLLGTFFLPNRQPIIIEEEWQQFGGMKMSKNCFGNNRVDIHIE